ncbi:VCBS domain-containing protein [Noviherbaspirillum sp. L7-7A]|uniref:VCBS domain-containing protein n=1 Tax=Noviherbaspirillum sp. L7-7A TaxID=2850560 RepID=UPI001C2C82A3|nr:VCBS domain-containing protein [Noviherbaspirillum sp. L7-7A]MBV0881847.1 VCBS domain-containing protein [Noviherbaspirillum sp. L7-7A]
MKNAKTPSKEQHLANGASAINGKKLVRRGPSPMALEQRFMFDGAALAYATQTVATADAAASHDVAVADSHQTDTMATATVVPAAPAAPPAPAPELMHVVSTAQEAPPALAQAQADAERLIASFLQQPDARAQLFELFHGSQGQPSAEWLQAADSFLASIQNGAAPVQVELRSHAEMQGAMAAFAAHGPDGQPVIYLNGDWARQVAAPEALTRALLEEYGHRIDASLNGDVDTAGDEGEAFAQRALGATPDADQAARIAAEDDHDTLQIDGRTVEVEQAAITFSVVYQGVPSSWSEEAQNLALYASPFNGSNYRFTSSNPSDLYFQGNNVTGYLSYQDQSGNRQQIYGVVSRLFKTGSTIDGFYFYAPGADGLINGVGDSAYLLAVTPSKFAGSTSYGTSSDPVDTALNSFIPPNSAPVAANDSASVLEDGSVSGNLLTNDSDANGDTLRVAQFSVSNQTYTLALGGSSTVTLASIGSLTVASNGSYSFTPVANYAGAVPLVTYTVTDGTASARASLSVGIVGVNYAPDGTDGTISTREDTAYVFSAADFGFTDRNDTPANALEAVKISSLPTQGTLLFNDVAITALQVSNGYFVAVADIGKLSFRPLANQAASASFTFQVRDNGGIANGSSNLDPVANTITFAIANVNEAPVAVSDTATAREAGGSANGTAGVDPTGNVLTNDTDPDTGDSKSVVSASSAATPLTSVATNTVLAGHYGTLTISSTGAYSYAVNNSNAAVQALRLSSDTLTDTFTYVMKDTAGLTSSSTLAVTITGANDAPVAVNDLGTAKEAGATLAYPGSNATGNVLGNDTDVDAGDAATLTQIFATATGVSTGGGSVTSTTFRVASITGIETGNDVFRGGTTTGSIGKVSTITPDSGGGSGGTIILDTSNTITNGETLQFSQSAGNSGNVVSNGLAVTTAIVSGSSSTVQLSNTYGTVLIGMTVTGTGNATDPTVTAVNHTTSVVTLSAPVTLSASTALRFVALPGSSIQGQRGTLNITANGVYTYTITNNDLSAGQTFDETFTYQMRDTAGLTSPAVLTVRIEGTSNDSEPDARSNTDTATEAGGVSNASGAVNPAGNVLTDDLGTNLVVSTAWSELNPGSASVTGGTTSANGLTITGNYGSLKLGADGSYIYTVNNSNAAVQALNTGATLTDLFFYRASNSSGTDVSTLKITVNGSNDAPVAVDDVASAAEAGGTTNVTPGYDAAGNVLANDTDVDNIASSRTITAVRLGGVEGSGTAGTVGSALQGSYGTLTVQAAGSYCYAVDNNNATVNGLAAGATLVEQFNYTVSDGSASDVAVLAITINGANDAPLNTVPASHVQYDYEQAQISGLSVHDVDGNLAASNTVSLSVGQGSLSVVLSGSAVAGGSGTAASPLVLSGSENDINATLATLRYQPAANHSGQDTLKLVTQDSLGLSDTDFTSITVQPDNRALTVNNLLVNEGSPYAVFTVGGQAGQLVRLAIANGSATGGSDFSANLEYYNGSAWAAYTGAAVIIPGSVGASTLLVRAAILNDPTYEGAETFTLTASNAAAVGVTGTATIVDDGIGNVYHDSATGAIDVQAIGDDDRPLTVSNGDINEASPYAIFRVGGASGQIVTLSLANGNASNSDHGTSLQYYDGTSWLDYSGPVAMPGAEMLVRVAIIQDSVYEGRETFNLSAANTGGLLARGEAAIYDNGTGSIYLSDNTTGVADTSGTGFPAALDDDRVLSVQGVRVNEASDHAVFTVSGTAGQFVSLHVVDGSASIAQGQTLQVWNGAAWVDYNSDVLPEISADGHLLVRVDIVAEQDATYEFEEDFRLQATFSSANGSAVVEGTGIIADDGSGLRFGNGVTGGVPQLIATGLDDDRSLAISDVTVSEASPYALFTVSGTPDQVLNLALQATGSGTGFATPGTDTGTALQYWTGLGWASYSSSATMTGGSLMVRVAINQDSVYEGPETFRLVATNSSGKITTGGTGTIRDDGGSTTVFGPSDTTPQIGLADDDRALAISDVTVSEASPYAVFTVSGTAGQVLNLSLQASGNGNGFATLGADTGAALQYWTGSAWADYSGSVTMSGSSLLVRVAVTQDSIYEGPETFRLLASNGSGKTSTGGTGTIRDDGGSNIVFNETDTTPQTGTLDDDRALAIADVTVSEASPYAVFTVSGTPGQVLDLALQATGSGTGFVTLGTDTGTVIQYFDGSAWAGYSGSVTMSGTSLLVRVAVTQDSVYEGAESFRLLATNSSSKTSTGGAGLIRDDGGSITVFNETDTTPQTGSSDDDRALAISDVTVSEASSYAMFTVNGTPGQVLNLALQTTGGGTGFATLGTDTGTALQYFNGSAWASYSGNVTMTGTSLLVRVAITQDSVYEGPETFRLLATNSSGKTSTGGTGTIRDDGASNIVFNKTDTTPQTGAVDDDRLLLVSEVTVSEASPYIVFTVSGTPGQTLALSLQANGTGAGFATPGTDTGSTLQYFNGNAWVSYGSSVTMSGSSLLVRTAIQQDGVYEGAETFRLLATNTSGVVSFGGTGTIRDDGGSSMVFNETDTTPKSGIADDDRTLAISDITVSEASPYAVFTVSGTAGQVLNLALQATGSGTGFATIGTDTGTALQYWTGSTWADDSGSVTMSGNSLLVRVAVTQDSVYEGSETFRLMASNSSGKASSGGTGAIRDGGGSSTVFNETDTTPQTGIADDDRALAVSDVTVSEASPYAVFTVSGTAGQVLNLSLQATGSGTGFATPGTDTGTALQYFNGSTWADYIGSVTMTGSSLLVRLAVRQDSVHEGPETFHLLATSSSGNASTGGTGTIRDDGASNIVFGDTDTTPEEGGFDDDRLLTVSNLAISEASPFAAFTVTGAAGQKLALALESGTAAVGIDTGTALQYLDGVTWRDYTPGSLVAIAQGGNTLLVRVAIVNDSLFEGSESFRLIATNRNGEAGVGTATLRDDGSSREVYLESNTNGRPTTGEADDDQARPQAVAQPVAPAPAAPAPLPAPQAPAPQQAAPFNSTLVLTEAARAPDALRSEPVGDLITSSAGFQIAVVEGDAAQLSTYRSVADQFVEGNRSVTFTLPYDAFVHTRAEATVVLAATLTDGQSLPAWIRFDARTGSFSLNPPPDFSGEMEVKVIARDSEGREAATVFRLFIGEDKGKLPARSSLSEQLRLAGKRSSPFAALVRGQEPQGQRQQMGRLGSKA